MTTAGVVVERYMYSPYGVVNIRNGNWSLNSNPGGSYDWVYLHQGGRWNAAAGTYHFRHRDYSPTLGRWMNQDPLGYVDGGNLYEYVRSGPTGSVDPMGLWGEGFRDRQKRIGDLFDKLKDLADNPDWTQYGRPQYSRRYRELDQKLRELQNDQTRGHSDFPGSDRFDYSLLDNDPLTSPLEQPWLHFQPLWWIDSEMQRAVDECDRDAFQRASHQGQDYYSHYLPGYRWDPSELQIGHIFDMGADDATKYWKAYNEAWRWTEKWVNAWDSNNCECRDE